MRQSGKSIACLGANGLTNNCSGDACVAVDAKRKSNALRLRRTATQASPLHEERRMTEALVEQTQFELTAEQVSFYHEHGYVAPLRLLDDRQLDEMRQRLEAM